MSQIIRKENITLPHQTHGLHSLDICAICPERENDCPMIMHCTQARRLTLELAKRRLALHSGRGNGKRMALAMRMNEICDMQCHGVLESIIARIGGEQANG